MQAGYYVTFTPFEDGLPSGAFEIFADGFAGVGPDPLTKTGRAQADGPSAGSRRVAVHLRFRQGHCLAHDAHWGRSGVRRAFCLAVMLVLCACGRGDTDATTTSSTNRDNGPDTYSESGRTRGTRIGKLCQWAGGVYAVLPALSSARRWGRAQHAAAAAWEARSSRAIRKH